MSYKKAFYGLLVAVLLFFTMSAINTSKKLSTISSRCQRELFGR